MKLNELITTKDSKHHLCHPFPLTITYSYYFLCYAFGHPPPPPPPPDSGICLSLFILVTAGEHHKSRSHSACIGAQGLRGFVPITQLNILHFYPTAWVRGATIKLHCNLTGRCPMYIFVSHIAYFYSQNLHKFIQDSRFQNQRREGIIQWA